MFADAPGQSGADVPAVARSRKCVYDGRAIPFDTDQRAASRLRITLPTNMFGLVGFAIWAVIGGSVGYLAHDGAATLPNRDPPSVG